MTKVDLNIALKSPLAKRYDNYIGGEWRPPTAGKYFDNVSPIIGQAERAQILNKIADRMEANLEMLATAETWANGKPIRETMAADLPLAVDHFR